MASPSTPHPYPQTSRPSRSKAPSPTTGEESTTEKDILSSLLSLFRSGQTTDTTSPIDLIYSANPPLIYPPISIHTPPIVSTFQQLTTIIRPTPTSSSSSSSMTKERKSKLKQQVIELTKNQTELTKTLNLIVAQMTHLNKSVKSVSKKGKGKASGSDDDDEDDKSTP